MPEADILPEITETDPMRREANRGLMVSWINFDPFARARHDVRTSIVLYDADKIFEAALDPAVGMSERIQKALRDNSNVRYWSKGIV